MDIVQKLKSGKNVYGTCFTSPAPGWAPVIKNAGLDFAFIDTEHTALNRADMSGMCQQMLAYGITPIVRIPSPDPFLAC